MIMCIESLGKTQQEQRIRAAVMTIARKRK